MPLRKLNRIIAINTLDKVNIFRNKAINEIYNIFNKKNKVSINDLGFFIGPILNAGGRLGKSSYATELLSTNDENLIKKRINNLIILNEKRKKIEDDIIKEINFNEIEKKNENIIIIYKKNINEGLIGIIAARLKEYFNKPSIIITNSGNLLKGSARSIHSFNIGISIKNAFDKNILINGGGHNMAAGFSLNKNKLNTFINFMNINYNKNISKDDLILRYTSKISSSAFNKKFFDEIKKIEPFGNDNHEPTFLFEKLKILKSKVIKDKHISIIFKSTTGFSINSFSFNSVNTKIGDYLLNYKKDLSIIGQIKENFWNNKYTLQLIVKDLVI